MMKQYEEAKAACGDALLLFRMGDFYELFHTDAEEAARLVGLTLTSRDKGENPIPMAGFPHHQLDSYLGKLIRLGKRVAICDQVEDPKQAKGLVRREVTRVVTAGTLTDDDLLDPRQSNYLVSLVCDTRQSGRAADATKRVEASPLGLAWIDLSTGAFFVAVIDASHLADELERIGAAELLLPDDFPLAIPTQKTPTTRRPDWTFSTKLANERLAEQFETKTLAGFGLTDDDALGIRAAGGILEYLRETQRTSLAHIERIVPYRTGTFVELDEATRRSLEIHRTFQDGDRDGSLLGVMDRTTTAMGSRLLANWLAHPLTDAEQMNQRLDAVSELVAQASRSSEIRTALRETYDLQRLLARVATGRASPRDLSFVGKTLTRLPTLRNRLADCESTLLRRLHGELDLCPDVAAELQRALVDDCPLSSRDGGMIRKGYHAELDELRALAAGGKQWIAEYQAAQVRDSGIPSLKVGYNKVFGYYIEVTNAHSDRVPEHFIRRQTLKNAERYVTPELKEYEEKVLVADQQATEREYELFVALRDLVQSATNRLQRTADILAQLDVLAGFAELARQRNYCRPDPRGDPVLDIIDGRHPVLDARDPDGTFVPNDTTMSPSTQRILLITGPNMAGKSTYIRQVALLTLMMQVGSFVPAKSARIGIADRLFARVGAGDRLAQGQSTFMVEMTEAARILNRATSQSLVILDEIGRGTSTYDGVSLAWAIVEHLHNHTTCRTLFATHYHELTDLAERLEGVHNLNVLVKEWDDKIAFLHKITAGAADKSYGIHVARLAGVPRSVQHRAQEILENLETAHRRYESSTASGPPAPHVVAPDTRVIPEAKRDVQLTLFAPYDHPLLDTIRGLDLEGLDADTARQHIAQWQERLAAEREESRLR